MYTVVVSDDWSQEKGCDRYIFKSAWAAIVMAGDLRRGFQIITEGRYQLYWKNPRVTIELPYPPAQYGPDALAALQPEPVLPSDPGGYWPFAVDFSMREPWLPISLPDGLEDDLL